MTNIKDKLNKVEIVTDGIVTLISQLSPIINKISNSNIDPEIESEIFFMLINNYKLDVGYAYDLLKILCNSVYKQYKFVIVDNQKQNTELITEKIKRHFGTQSTIIFEKDIKQTIKKITKDDNMILCESIKNDFSTGWWVYLMDTDREIFTKINPDFEEDNITQNYYAITKLSTKPNYDRSFIIAETSEPVGINWLKTVLVKLKIPVYKVIESIATYKRNVIHLIEITGNIDESDIRFGKELKISGIKFELLKKIGGYFQKINSIENNQLLFLK